MPDYFIPELESFPESTQLTSIVTSGNFFASIRCVFNKSSKIDMHITNETLRSPLVLTSRKCGKRSDPIDGVGKNQPDNRFSG